MKKVLALIPFVLLFGKINSQTLSSGNIVVLRVGDSVATLANTGNTLALDQFTLTGTYVNSIILPKTGANAVCLSGSATSEGMLNLAGDRSAIVFFAYRTAPPFTSSISGSTSAAVNRAVVSVNNSGAASIPTFTNINFSGNNPRHVFSDGLNYWVGGGNSGIAIGRSGFNLDTIVTTSSTNTRFISNGGGQLYFATASVTPGIWRLGSGAPKNSGNIAAPYITTAGIGTGTASPYSFSMRFDSTVCYIADDRSIANGGGIQKWTRTGSTWTLAYTLGTGAGSTVGARGLAVNWTTTPPTIIATTAESTLNRIIRINDTSASVTAVTLAIATSNTIFRGVAYTPGTTTLPVKFTHFKAALQNNETILNWGTSSEINNKGFEIEKSLDGENFESIGFVAGKGNSNKINKYAFVDPNYSAATQYYRLKQIDFDGNFEYSNQLTVSNQEEPIFNISPNPFENEISIMGSNNEEKINAEIIDINGKVKISATGNGNVSLNANELANGIYFIRVNNGEKVFVKRIIKN
jgi:hypothetical protein